MMKIKDERLEQNTNKIWAEMMRIVYLFIAISFAIKSLYLKMDLYQCLTEYVVLIGIPIYQAVRTRQLGVVYAADMERALAPKTIFASILLGIVIIIFLWVTSGSQLSAPGVLKLFAIYIVVFILSRIFFVRMEKNRLKKLENEYDDEE